MTRARMRAIGIAMMVVGYFMTIGGLISEVSSLEYRVVQLEAVGLAGR